MTETGSINSSIPQLNLDDQPHDDPIDYQPIDENQLFHRLGGFNDIKGFNAKSLGLTTGNDMFNALDSTKFDITTSEILRVHLLRILLTFILFIHMHVVHIYQLVEDAVELINIFWLDLWSVSQLDSEVMTFGIYFINNISCGAIFTKNLIYNVPSVFLRLMNNMYLRNNPSSGLINFKLSIPQHFLPNSISVILEINQAIVSPPPSIPQPYLNADKKITVPSKREIQQVLAIRNEYFTHQSVHIAAEKVRIQSEIARFVTWCSLIPSLSTINIYERFGLVWDTPEKIESSLEMLGSSILNELSSFANSCFVYELEDLRVLIPRITLVEVMSGKSYTINQLSTLPQQPPNPDQTSNEIESLISSYSDDRELIVNLCDSRMNDDLIGTYLGNVFEAGTELDEDDMFHTLSELIPSTPDMIIIPGKNNVKHMKLSGYKSIINEEDVASTVTSPIFYFSKIRFGFPFFIRSLYYYALNSDVSQTELVDFVNGATVRQTLQQQALSSETAIANHYLVNFFKRLRGLKLFDLNSSPANPNEYENEANLLLNSSELLTANV
ncbi:hypothetical protein DFJ63DRAFT_320042 [Scheffersomyces coipomensis]|uniref:uncharacterized protein n=1 Tax=Scheffersomyces coipomensis TaxID=1788519 RepID=UPI00315CD9A6